MRTDSKPLILSLLLAAAITVPLAGCNQGNADLSSSAAESTVGTDIDDTLVTTKVKTALLADADINSFDLKVETRKGAVQLSGYVDNQTQIDRAITATRAVEGVRTVENGIMLKSGSTSVGNAVDDSLITTRVKSALLAEPNIKSSDIAVVTRKGAVQLSGYVDSQAQIDKAIIIARAADGVTSVGNEMSIKQ